MAECLAWGKEIPDGYHFCEECGTPLVEQHGKVIVHREFEGEHETDGDSCWCQPVEVDADTTLRDGDEIAAEIRTRLDG